MTPRPKCNLCNQACRKNQSCIKCSICEKFVHRKCAKISIVDLRLMELSKKVFYCQVCLDNDLPLQGTDNDSDVFTIPMPKFDCDANLDHTYLNNLFVSPNNDDADENENIPEEFVFKPIPARYYAKNSINFDDIDTTLQVNSDGAIPNKFSSLGINMRSLANAKNFAKLQLFLKTLSFQPTVIAINETYLRDNESGPHCSLDGYVFVSNCRKNHKGGGVGIYVKDTLNFKLREDLTIMDEKIFESLFIEIKCANKTVVYGTIYRSPNPDSDATNIFLSYLNKCSSKTLVKPVSSRGT